MTNFLVHMGSGCGQCFLLLAALTWTPTEPPNVTGEKTVYGPTGESNGGPLAYRARTQTTDLKSNTHRRPVTISICLLGFIPESTPNHAGTDETVPLLPASQTLTHTEPQNVKGEEKLPIIFSPAEDRTHDPLHSNQNLYRAAIKSGLYRKAVQVCYIPNTTTYSGIHRGYLPPSVAFQLFSVIVRSFRAGSPVYSLTFVDVKKED